MPKIFREFRMEKLKKGKIVRYVYYAIGEIILVVIGILLALQINNWNNDRLQHKKEISYLKEIRKNLISDTITINRVLDFNERKIKIVEGCLRDISKSKTNCDRIAAIGSRLDILPNFDLYIPNDIGFRNMMSAENIELISDENLRNAISDFYHFDFSAGTQERLVQVTRNFVDYTLPRLANRERFKEDFNLDMELPSIEEIEIQKNPFIISYFNALNAMMEAQNDLLIDTKRTAKELIQNVSKELNKNDG